MKKVIVFRVENVLVKDYDEVKMFDLKKRRLVKEMLEKVGLELEGKEWDENDGVNESYLTEHGNGWFMWKKTKNNLLEIEMMENGKADIPQENTITVLTATEFFYKDQAGRAYQFIKVQ